MSEQELVPVEIEVKVRRTVYVYASTDREARRHARDVEEWADADPHHDEDPTSVRVVSVGRHD